MLLKGEVIIAMYNMVIVLKVFSVNQSRILSNQTRCNETNSSVILYLNSMLLILLYIFIFYVLLVSYMSKLYKVQYYIDTIVWSNTSELGLNK